jgi:hypothetical protein
MMTCPYNDLASTIQLALARTLRGQLERDLALDSSADDGEWVRVLQIQAPMVTDEQHPGIFTITPVDARTFQEVYAPNYLFRAADTTRSLLAWLNRPKV